MKVGSGICLILKQKLMIVATNGTKPLDKRCKAAGGPEAVERAFVLANFKENQETFEELFYQVNGPSFMEREMDALIVDKIGNQLLPQAAK